MKHKITLALFIVIVAMVVIDSFTNQGLTFSSGPPAGYTGSPVDAFPNRNCTACHAGPAATTQAGWITSTIPAGGYKAGITYTITATATRSGHTRFGFQISPQNATGALLGTLIVTSTANTQTVGSGKYIEHTTAGTIGTANFHTWTFGWTAPAVAGSGTVTFYGAFNVTNASNSNSGDTIYLSTLQVQECNLPPPVITAGGPTTFCQGGSVTLFSSAATSYLWSNGATTQSTNVTTSGNYTITVFNASGCSATSTPTTVTVNPNPPTPVITAGGPTTFCQGGSVTLFSSVATSYLWSNGVTTQSTNVATSGNYSVTVTTSGCSATSAPTAVTVNPNPAIPIITANGPTTFCEGGSVILTSNTATSYLWSSGDTTQSINVTIPGNYSVTIKNVSGCSATSAPTAVNVNSNPEAPTIAGDDLFTFCEGGSVTLTSSAATSYLWNSGETTQSISVTASGDYSVMVFDINGCSATSAPTTVTVNICTALNLKIFLEGFYLSTDSMLAVIDPVNYPLLCDTITVELHLDSTDYNLAYTVTNTIDIYGNGSFLFIDIVPNNYYIVVRHRNTIETWSKLPLAFGSPSISFDFTRP